MGAESHASSPDPSSDPSVNPEPQPSQPAQPAQQSERGYRHQRPRRPPRLPKRLEPPPERHTVDISWMIYIGIGLALLLALLAVPYAIGYIVEILSA